MSEAVSDAIQPPSKTFYGWVRTLQALVIIALIATTRLIIGNMINPNRPWWITILVVGVTVVLSVVCGIVWAQYRSAEARATEHHLLAGELARMAAQTEQLSEKVADMQTAFDAGRRYGEATTADSRLRSVN